MGFSIRIMPGVRISASSRGIRAGIGPRVARIHVGAGGTGFSSGVGPFTYYTGGGRRRTATSTWAVSEREALFGMRSPDFDRIYAADVALVALAETFRASFPSVTAPVPEELQPVDDATLVAEAQKRALAGIPRLNRAARRAAGEQALREIEAEREHQLSDLDKRNADALAAWTELRNNSPAAVLHAIEEAYADNTFPAAPIDCDGNRAVVVVTLPSRSTLVADRSAALGTGGEFTVTPRPQREQNGLYVAVLGSQVLATAREALAVAPGLKYVTVLALERDDSRTGFAVLYLGTFRRSRLAEIDWSGISLAGAIQELRTDGALLNQDPYTEELHPVDLTDQPDLRRVVDEVRGGLGFTEKQSSVASRPDSQEDLSQIPVVRDHPWFSRWDTTRRAALARYESAADPADRAKSLAQAIDLLGLQVSALLELVADVEALPVHAPQRLVAKDWLEAWTTYARDELVRLDGLDASGVRKLSATQANANPAGRSASGTTEPGVESDTCQHEPEHDLEKNRLSLDSVQDIDEFVAMSVEALGTVLTQYGSRVTAGDLYCILSHQGFTITSYGSIEPEARQAELYEAMLDKAATGCTVVLPVGHDRTGLDAWVLFTAHINGESTTRTVGGSEASLSVRETELTAHDLESLGPWQAVVRKAFGW